MKFIAISSTFLILITSYISISAQTKLLVDFGATEAENIFNETDFPGWNNVEVSGATYSNNGPGGLETTGGTIFSNYQKISGPSITLYPGDEIIITWYNNTGAKISFWKPLISFEDPDHPNDMYGEPQWYPLFDLNAWETDDLAIAPDINYMPDGTTRKSIYAVSSFDNTPGDLKASEGQHMFINICANNEKSGIVCDKIEIRRSSDCKPEAPLNLSATLNAEKPDSRVDLQWEAPSDGVILHYRIYQDGLWVAKTKETKFTVSNLEHSTTYSFSVRAVMNQYAMSEPSSVINITTEHFQGGDNLIDPKSQITYLGAFKYPDYSNGAGHTWNRRWGGMAYYPAGDPENVDGDSDYKGSIYAYGHEYGHRLAEISIPEPLNSKNYDDLPSAQMLVDSFRYVKPLNDERPSDYGHPGIAYLQSKNRFYTCFGYYYNQSGDKWLTHGSFKPDYTEIQGLWYIGDKNSDDPPYYVYNKYMAYIPSNWAEANTPDFLIATGANHTGADPMGPGLVAIRPWNSDGSTPAPGDELDYITLLQYDMRGNGKCMDGWLQKDFWMGLAWIEHNGRSAVVISGSKTFGEYYYGYQDGSTVSEIKGCVPQGHNTDGSDKGGQARRFRGMLLFYNPDDFARVAKTKMGLYSEGDPEYMTPNEPQPYAYLDIDDVLLRVNHNSPLGRDRITGMTFDKENGLLYVNECRASDDIHDVIHVFKINDNTTGILKKASNGNKSDRCKANAAYPVPFSSVLNIPLQLKKDQKVSVSIVDISGKKICNMINNESYTAGNHIISWNSSGLDLNHGIYFYQIKTEDSFKSCKIIKM